MHMVIRCLFLICFGGPLNSWACQASDIVGTYTSSEGETLTLSLDDVDGSYWLTIDDVTVGSIYRKSDEFSCWLFFSYFDVVIPKVLEDGMVVENAGTKVSVRKLEVRESDVLYSLDVVASPWQDFGLRRLKVFNDVFRYQIKYSNKYGIFSFVLLSGEYIKVLSGTGHLEGTGYN